MKSSKWITVGKVRANWFVLVGNCGFPDGYYMHWQGRVGMFQPCEFVQWEDLVRTMNRRLRMAGLKRVEGPLLPGGGNMPRESVGLERWVPEWQAVRVKVERVRHE